MLQIPQLQVFRVYQQFHRFIRILQLLVYHIQLSRERGRVQRSRPCQPFIIRRIHIKRLLHRKAGSGAALHTRLLPPARAELALVLPPRSLGLRALCLRADA